MGTSVENLTRELRDQDDPDAGSTYLVAVIGTILFLAITVFTIWLFNNYQRIEDQTKLYAPRPREIAELQTAQLAQISDSRWVDEPAGLVAIPVQDAIPLFVKRVKAGAPVSPATISSPARAKPAASEAQPGTMNSAAQSTSPAGSAAATEATTAPH